MDLHFATEKVSSVKDALLRYAVIVAGILTALGLNQWVESRQHAHQGQRALASISAELRRDRGALTKVVEVQQRTLDKLEAVQDRLGKDSFAVPDLPARAQAVLKSGVLDEVTDFSLAALQHSAWDTAVAGQGLQYVDPQRAVALARAYAAIFEVSTIARQTAVGVGSFENLIAIDMYSRGESKDAMRFARALRQHALVLSSLNRTYRALGTILDAEMAVALGDGTASASSAASAAPGSSALAPAAVPAPPMPAASASH